MISAIANEPASPDPGASTVTARAEDTPEAISTQHRSSIPFNNCPAVPSSSTTPTSGWPNRLASKEAWWTS